MPPEQMRGLPCWQTVFIHSDLFILKEVHQNSLAPLRVSQPKLMEIFFLIRLQALVKRPSKRCTMEEDLWQEGTVWR